MKKKSQNDSNFGFGGMGTKTASSSESCPPFLFNGNFSMFQSVEPCIMPNRFDLRLTRVQDIQLNG